MSSSAVSAAAAASSARPSRDTPLIDTFWKRTQAALANDERPPSLIVTYASAQPAYVLRAEPDEDESDGGSATIVLYDHTQKLSTADVDAGCAPPSVHEMDALLCDDDDDDEDDMDEGDAARGTTYRYASEYTPASADQTRAALQRALDAARADGFGAFVEVILTKWVYRESTRTFHERIAERFVDVARNGTNASRIDDTSDVPLLGRAILGTALLAWLRFVDARVHQTLSEYDVPLVDAP